MSNRSDRAWPTPARASHDTIAPSSSGRSGPSGSAAGLGPAIRAGPGRRGTRGRAAGALPEDEIRRPPPVYHRGLMDRPPTAPPVSRPLRWVALIVVAVTVVFGRAGSFGFVHVRTTNCTWSTTPYLHPFTAASAAALWAAAVRGAVRAGHVHRMGDSAPNFARRHRAGGRGGPTLEPGPVPPGQRRAARGQRRPRVGHPAAAGRGRRAGGPWGRWCSPCTRCRPSRWRGRRGSRTRSAGSGRCWRSCWSLRRTTGANAAATAAYRRRAGGQAGGRGRAAGSLAAGVGGRSAVGAGWTGCCLSGSRWLCRSCGRPDASRPTRR